MKNCIIVCAFFSSFYAHSTLLRVHAFVNYEMRQNGVDGKGFTKEIVRMVSPFHGVSGCLGIIQMLDGKETSSYRKELVKSIKLGKSMSTINSHVYYCKALRDELCFFDPIKDVYQYQNATFFIFLNKNILILPDKDKNLLWKKSYISFDKSAECRVILGYDHDYSLFLNKKTPSLFDDFNAVQKFYCLNGIKRCRSGTEKKSMFLHPYSFALKEIFEGICLFCIVTMFIMCCFPDFFATESLVSEWPKMTFRQKFHIKFFHSLPTNIALNTFFIWKDKEYNKFVRSYFAVEAVVKGVLRTVDCMT